ncbi:hypothetical protein H6P81_018966 [Aristolochia fimbriata]|uniref:RING-type E3 ubiquitin transferase n=1 Tax=Aristolochia fimbriata TaxID=158543 RepID=A0AAV7E6N3_ARIFI|nr:hypothetical protein H6P81_018966 [Aristolochia fimbriata]
MQLLFLYETRHPIDHPCHAVDDDYRRTQETHIQSPYIVGKGRSIIKDQHLYLSGTRSAREAKENRKLERSLISIDQNYKNFSWEEIVSSTSSFSDALKIGMGAYGMVYKCNLGHAAAAVKVLHSSNTSKANSSKRLVSVCLL